jgi:hypothetical protein
MLPGRRSVQVIACAEVRFITSSRSESVQSWAAQRITQLLGHISGYLEGEPAQV